MEMVHESEKGHIVITNGPFLDVSAQAVVARKRNPASNPRLPAGLLTTDHR